MKQDAVTDAPKEPRRWTLHEVRGVVESVCPWADPSRCLDRHEHLESVEAAAFDALAAKLAATEEAFEIAERQLAEAEKRIGGLISQRDAAELKLAEAERELFLMRRVAEGNEAEIARLTRELSVARAGLSTLREVVEAAKKHGGYCPVAPELHNALAALEEKK